MTQTMTQPRVIGARQLCWNLIDQQMKMDMWGGPAYIHMRTPMFSLSTDGKTGKERCSAKMRKYHATQLQAVMGEDGKPLILKSGENKGKPKMQGIPNPFWDFEADRPKIIKHTLMQVQIGFNWFEVMKSMQREAGVTPDYAGGTVKTWRSETRFIEVEMLDGSGARKTVFFHRMNINTETGEVKPFNPKKDNIYLACLRPMKPFASMPTKVWYEELDGGRRLTTDEEKLVRDVGAFALAERDEDEIAEQQGHAGRPDLNRQMFTPSVRNILSISAFGAKYRMPRRPWDEVTPVNFADIEGIEVEEDPITREVAKVVADKGYRKIKVE